MADIINDASDLRNALVDEADGSFIGFSADELAIDSLTQFYQRKVWMKEASHALAHAKRNNEKAALLFIDLNNLKIVNDDELWGSHDLGNLYVKGVADVIRRSIRDEDIAGRLGGDEFVIFLSEMSKEDIGVLVDRLKEKVKDEIQNNSEFKGVPNGIIGIAVGFCIWDGQESLDETVTRADRQMYLDKRLSKEKKTRSVKMYVTE